MTGIALTPEKTREVRNRGWDTAPTVVVPTPPAEASRLRALEGPVCNVDAASIRRLDVEERLAKMDGEIQTDVTMGQTIRRKAKTASAEEAVTLAAELRGIELRAAGLEARRREIVAEIEMIDRDIQAAKENGYSALRRGEHAAAIAAQCLADIAMKEDEIRRLQSTAEGQARVAKVAFEEAKDYLGSTTAPPMSEADKLAELLKRHDEERGR
jgi:hypothetical protein